jgi:hypothetical protein
VRIRSLQRQRGQRENPVFDSGAMASLLPQAMALRAGSD